MLYSDITRTDQKKSAPTIDCQCHKVLELKSLPSDTLMYIVIWSSVLAWFPHHYHMETVNFASTLIVAEGKPKDDKKTSPSSYPFFH